MAGAAVLMLAAVGVGQASRLDQPWERWQQLPAQLPRDARWLVAQAAWRGAGDAGWLGLGPGTFRVAFPYLTGYLGDRVQGFWRFLHEDYLQTLLEWGRVGALLWSAFLFGGIFVAIRNSRAAKDAGWSPRRREMLPLIYLPLLATALHAAVDFPLQIASIQLYVATYLGICWGSSSWEGRQTEVRAKTRARVNAPAVAREN
jgi:O-antigen ligase